MLWVFIVAVGVWIFITERKSDDRYRMSLPWREGQLGYRDNVPQQRILKAREGK
jgi:hypothetical protein